MSQQIVRDFKHTIGDGQRLYIPQELVRAYGEVTGDGQGMQTFHRRWPKPMG